MINMFKSLILAFILSYNTTLGQEIGGKYKYYYDLGVQNLREDGHNYSLFHAVVNMRDTTFGELASISVLNQDDVKILQELSKKIINNKRNYSFFITWLNYSLNLTGWELVEPTVKCDNKDVVAYIETSYKIYKDLYEENKRLEAEAKQASEEAAIRKKYDDMRKADSLKQVETLRQQRLRDLEDSLRRVYEKEKLDKELKEQKEQPKTKTTNDFDEQRKKQQEELNRIRQQRNQ